MAMLPMTHCTLHCLASSMCWSGMLLVCPHAFIPQWLKVCTVRVAVVELPQPDAWMLMLALVQWQPAAAQVSGCADVDLDWQADAGGPGGQ